MAIRAATTSMTAAVFDVQVPRPSVHAVLTDFQGVVSDLTLKESVPLKHAIQKSKVTKNRSQEMLDGSLLNKTFTKLVVNLILG